ncbi:ABC transporter permease [Streptomyces sp. RKND-216]|uniref:ABC transporter permease n=1 Tax=Streptomyces sp. RKND-216 TaxID=2562581 RepID=UPI001B34B576|nr:ABC transporter permease [Streptomyces sp. RKND-216]
MRELKPAALLRLALAGTRTDTLRAALTALGAAVGGLAALCAATVLAIDPPGPFGAAQPGSAQHYSSALLRQPGLRPGVVLALLMMTLPVLALLGQCARIGAPARDRRLAAVRLAGATPRQVRVIAATETGLSALVGTVAGLGAFLVLRAVLHDPGPDGRLPFPTDVLPSPLAFGAVVLGLPGLAALTAVVLLRRAVVSPLGVTRRARRRGAPRPWPAALIALGLALATLAQFTPLIALDRPAGPPVGVALFALFGGGICCVLGVVLGAGWITHTAGRVLHRYARGPAALVASRRLREDPWSGSRAFAAVLTCVVVGAVAAGVRELFAALVAARAEVQRRSDIRAGREPTGLGGSDADFYLGTMDLVQVAVLLSLVVATLGLIAALAEGVVSRRGAHAALAATGVPRRVLRRVVAWQTFAPLVPATALALTVGTLLARGYGHEYEALGSKPSFHVVREAAVPWAELGLYGAVTLALAGGAVAVGWAFLRSGTSVEDLRTG